MFVAMISLCMKSDKTTDEQMMMTLLNVIEVSRCRSSVISLGVFLVWEW